MHSHSRFELRGRARGIASWRSRAVCALSTAVLTIGSAYAKQDLKLSQMPVNIPEPPPPNVLLVLDDSGSMAEFVNSPPPAFNATGEPVPWVQPLFANRWCTSSHGNSIAYDPNVTYDVPRNADGSLFPSADFRNVSTNAYFHNPVMLNLSNMNAARLHQYVCQDGNPTPTRLGPFHRPFLGVDPNPFAEQNYGNRIYIDSSDEQNYANFFAYYRMRGSILRTALTRVFASLELGTFRLAWGEINKTLPTAGNPQMAISPMRIYDEPFRKTFFDWITKSGNYDGETPTRRAMGDVKRFFSGGYAGNNPFLNKDGVEVPACTRSYQILVTDGEWNESDAIVPSVNGDEASRTLPDPDDSLSGAPVLGSYDPGSTSAKVYANPAMRTLADFAFDLWATDFQSGVDNVIAPRMVDMSAAHGEPAWNPANDPSTWQGVSTHVVTLAMGLQPSEAQLQQIRNGTRQWRDPYTVPFAKQYDLWHASVNGRGRFISANTGNEVVDAFDQIFAEILNARGGTGSGVALTSGTLSAGGVAYSTRFEPGVWTGTLLALKLGSNGNAAGTLWDAACILTGGGCVSGVNEIATGAPSADARVILSVNSDSGTGTAAAIPFRWSSLGSTQQAALNGSDSLGANRLAWLRGDRTQEAGRGGVLRKRTSVMGDVINAQAVFVGRPLSAYPDNWGAGMPESNSAYSAFLSANATRAARIYVGANDGMLHAFDDQGAERFAYVPAGVYPNLALLTAKRYKHQSYVDATPVVRDVFMDGKWRTVLVGGLRHGGKGLYALDITNPDEVTESKNPLLWDHTATTNANVGNINTAPYIARLADGHWWAVSGNGYNSTSGLAALVLVRLDTGELRTIAVPDVADPLGKDRRNGLSGAVVSDLNRDLIGEYAYAGDIFGNVWKFDLSSSNPDEWSVFQTGNVPMLAASTDAEEYEPITATPRLGYADDGQLVVIVGTGKYIEGSDRISAGYPTQAIYGLFDDNQRTGLDRDELVEQSVNSITTVHGEFTTRQTSDNPVSTQGDDGWRLALPEEGERVIQPGFLRDGVAYVPTIVPSGDGICTSGGNSWLMTLDITTGGAPMVTENGHRVARPVLDLNGDKKVDGDDVPSSGSTGGIQLGDFINGIVLAVDPSGLDTFLLTGSSGTITPITGKGLPLTRVSWRDITRR